jgi:two-component system NtrC family sensor kinase
MESSPSELTAQSGSASSVAGSAFPFSLFDTEYAEPHDRRILVVDDEEAVRKLYATYLDETYSCATAGDAQAALDLMATEQFALVLSDMRMPGLSGTELLRKIVERYPDTAVIMISGVDRTQRVIDAIRVGASDYLVKPCDLDVLSFSVERALERRTLLRTARLYKRDLEDRNLELASQKAELARLQGQMVQAEKMASLGLLAAGVAHELNNPAGFIYSNVDVLKDYVGRLSKCLRAYDAISLTADDAAQIAELKEHIDYENIMSDLDSTLADTYIGAERIRDVVQNLRLFSRLDEGEIKRVDIHEGLEATIRLLSRYFKTGRITVTRDYGNLPPVTCYAAQINQVWMNLLVNAAQAIGDDEGTVHIQSRGDGDHVTISISDTGKGISDENVKKIFDPFFTTKPIGEGTGLGLSITHGIIVQHHGTIKIESAAGKGTTFVITLPLDIEPTSDE